jgi:serine/threonine protein kinase
MATDTTTDNATDTATDSTNSSASATIDKSYKICSVLGGLDVTRLVSSSTRSFFGGAIEDVELVREFVSEAITNQGLRGGLSDLSALNQTLDWAARGFDGPTTTLEAGMGYCDDRSDRRIDRLVSVPNKPLVGDKQTDMAIVDSVSLLFPWIVDRKSNHKSWWVDHQNGRSEGSKKEPFLFDALYTAAWIGSYGEAWAYYPPLRVFGEGSPLNLADVIGGDYNSHDEAFVKPNLPQNNRERTAFFTTPYPDTAVPGLSLITAMAPIYYTGSFRDYTYNDTYIASTGLDIAVPLVSPLLEVLDDKLTQQSFGILVDATNFATIVITQAVVDMIYPPLTGFEEERVTYDKTDGTVVQDRRNQTYLVSDTILQDLTTLANANWTGLHADVQALNPGARGYSTMNLTLTNHESPTEFYVMYERWQYVADWVLLVFAPTAEVDNAVNVGIFSTQDLQTSALVLEGVKGTTLVGRAIIINRGSLDVTVSMATMPSWIRLVSTLEGHLRAGENATVEFDVLTVGLDVGTSSVFVTLNVQDDAYPDCFFDNTISFELSVKVLAVDCVATTGDKLRVADEDGNCICASSALQIGGNCVANSVLLPSILIPLLMLAFLAVHLYVKRKRKQADSVWAVMASELRFDDPPEIVGRGTFGLVLRAEYRGTQVAVKRVIPPKVKASKDKGTQVEKRNLLLGAGDIANNDSTEGGKNIVGTQSTVIKLKKKVSATNVMFDFKDEEEVIKSTVPVSDDDEEVDEDGVIQCYVMEAGTFQRRQSMVTMNTGRSAMLKERSENSQLGHSSDEPADTNATVSSNDFNVNGLKSGAYKNTKSNGRGTRSGSAEKTHSLWHKHVMYRDEYSRLKIDFIREMRHLSTLRHPCITTVMGAVINKLDEPMLVMELMEHGSLYDVLHNETMVIEGEFVLPILRDIAQGLRFLHSAVPQVIHGDLKAQNILVDSKFRAKVADFGLSQKKQVGAAGTPLWMAPELLRGESDNTAASDVYSFGIILYEVYSRKDPYQGEDHRRVLEEICDPSTNKRPPIPSSMPPAIVSLMSDCLVEDPGSRPTFEELDNRLRRLDVANIEPGKMKFSIQNKQMTDAERNISLLLEVFPKHIAEALRDGRKVEPEHHDCVTIFFSDIVGFTTIAGSVSVLKVADMLDRLYLRFDNLSRIYDVFKIETIGDAWMGVTNLVKDQPDHAKRLAQFAIAAVQAASETPIDLEDPARGNVQIRVGFHSGPVLSNVIGSRNPKYSIFGDTVNTSARMESHSLPGRIQCSERAAGLLKAQGPEILLAYRGTIHVKGKGEMDTYWVNEVASLANQQPPEGPAFRNIQKGESNCVDDAEESEAQKGMVSDDALPPV